MASTNKTQYFELSQYTSSDKPTYLVDYNGDMSKIDGGLHTATVNSSNALTSVGNITNLNTTVKTDTVSAINEVVGNVTDNSADIVTNSNNISTNSTSIGVLANLSTVTKTDLVSATNEVNSKVGNLSNLNTVYKNDIVGSINEIKADINSSASYSTTEQVVGTWENSDGTQQHIYRRIKYFTSTNLTTSAWIPLMALPNCKDLVMIRMGLTFNTADSSYSSVWNDVLCRYANGNVEYYVEIGHKANYIIIEYTKTTD